MAEELMTFEQWNREMLVRGCKSEGHPPSDVVRAGLDGMAVYATCRCGEVRWVPQFVGENKMDTEKSPCTNNSRRRNHR